MTTAVRTENWLTNAYEAEDPNAPIFLVAYAKIMEDKDDGIYMQGVYFGGVSKDPKEAEAIAKECINTMKGTILPRVFPVHGQSQVLEGMQRAAKRFYEIEVQMFQAEDIMNRTQARQKASR